MQDGCGRAATSPDVPYCPGRSSRTYEVVLGEYDMSAGEGTEQRIPVAPANIFVHPKWRSSCLSCG